MNSTKKRQVTIQPADNPVEIVKNLTIGVVKTAASDLVGGVMKSTSEQLGFIPSSKIEETLKPNEEVNLSHIEQTKKGWSEEKIIRPLEKQVFNSSDVLIQRKIEEILRELKLLAKSIEKVNQEAGKIVMEAMPVNPGIYHLNFFEWILKLLKTARAKVEESAVWLSLFKSRKKQKEYWAMFKKHGTTFGLSHERVLATQTG